MLPTTNLLGKHLLSSDVAYTGLPCAPAQTGHRLQASVHCSRHLVRVENTSDKGLRLRLASMPYAGLSAVQWVPRGVTHAWRSTCQAHQ